MIALPYTEYLQRYGATRDAMAHVVAEARRNGARIPWSYWHDIPFEVGDYLAEPMINDPICRLDCDIPVDGVACFVLTSAARALDLPHRPVYISGYATGARFESASRCTGRSTTSWKAARKRPGDCGSDRGSDRARSISLRFMTDFPPSCISGWNRSGSLHSGRPIAWCSTVGSTPIGRGHCRCFRAAAHLETGGCTAFHRCSSAICSSQAALAIVNAERIGRCGVSLVAPLRRRSDVQRSAVLTSMAKPSKSEVHAQATSNVESMSWAERVADQSPMVQRSRVRGVEQARSIVAAARRLTETKGPSFTTQELIKEAGIALQTFYRYFSSKDYLLLAVIEDIIEDNCRSFRERAERCRTQWSDCDSTLQPRCGRWKRRGTGQAS